jgi:predicted transposase YdaD
VGSTVDDFTSSVAYREIFGLGHQQGEQEGEQKGRQAEAVAISLRLHEHRCGALTPKPTDPHPGPPAERA